jgi:hypothetical protein
MPARFRFNKDNTMEKFYDTSFSSQADGSIRLIQSDCGEDYIIDLHPEQLLFIARRLCGMKPETAGKVAELERRLSVLTDKLQNIVCNKAFRSDLIEGIGEGFAYSTPKQPPIPTQTLPPIPLETCHLFRSKVCHRSEANPPLGRVGFWP